MKGPLESAPGKQGFRDYNFCGTEIKGKMMQCKEYNMTEKEVTDDGYKEYTEAKGMVRLPPK